MRTKQLFAALDRVDREFESGPARALTKLLRFAVSRPSDCNWVEDAEWSEEDDYQLAEVIFWREGAAVCGGAGRDDLILRLAFCLEMVLKGDQDEAVREHLEDAPKWVRMLAT